MPSFYLVELLTEPGGVRKGDTYAVATAEEVRSIVDDDLADATNIYVATWYGETIQVTPYPAGQAGPAINLLPHITIAIPNYPTITYDMHGTLQGFDFAAEDDDEDMDEEDTLAYKLFTDEAGDIRVTIDWAAVALPALPAPLLRRSEQVEVYSNYLQQRCTIHYGHNDLEGGDDRDAQEGDG